MKHFNAITSKTGHSSLSMGGSNYRALTEKTLVFWIDGRLWEVVAYERWLHIEV